MHRNVEAGLYRRKHILSSGSAHVLFLFLFFAFKKSVYQTLAPSCGAGVCSGGGEVMLLQLLPEILVTLESEFNKAFVTIKHL